MRGGSRRVEFSFLIRVVGLVLLVSPPRPPLDLRPAVPPCKAAEAEDDGERADGGDDAGPSSHLGSELFHRRDERGEQEQHIRHHPEQDDEMPEE